MNDIIIRMLGELPVETLGVTVLDHNGDYNIYLNPAYDEETLRKTVDHEVAHIQNGHFYREGSIEMMEAEADEAAERIRKRVQTEGSQEESVGRPEDHRDEGCP